ncbi:hypothetical protein N8V28_21395 [Enterobacter hormaechei subsp. hoffmannii]|nr:hypothetical protein [Enterobacter hormaechei subsp. hoffmannii]
MEPSNELLIKIAKIRIEEAQTQLNYDAPAQVLDAARVDLRLAEMALSALQDKGKPPAQPVAEVVAWSHPQSPRTCDIRALRPDIAPGLLYDAPPAPAVQPVMFIDGDISPADADKIAAIFRDWEK